MDNRLLIVIEFTGVIMMYRMYALLSILVFCFTAIPAQAKSPKDKKVSNNTIVNLINMDDTYDKNVAEKANKEMWLKYLLSKTNESTDDKNQFKNPEHYEADDPEKNKFTSCD